MDNLTHTLSGLVTARLVPAGKLPMRTRYIAGALAANMPDLDILLARFPPSFTSCTIGAKRILC